MAYNPDTAVDHSQDPEPDEDEILWRERMQEWVQEVKAALRDWNKERETRE
jgi:hypothetical protein